MSNYVNNVSTSSKSDLTIADLNGISSLGSSSRNSEYVMLARARKVLLSVQFGNTESSNAVANIF